MLLEKKRHANLQVLKTVQIGEVLDRYVVDRQAFQFDGLQIRFAGKDVHWQIVEWIVTQFTGKEVVSINFAFFFRILF